MMYDFICIGYGVATASLILSLTQFPSGINILVFDNTFDGGDLRRHYGQVTSNTTWLQFLNTIQKYCSPAKFAALKALHGPEETTKLDELVYHFNSVVQAAVASSSIKIHKRCEQISEVSYEGNRWKIGSYEGKTLIVCTGADPKTLGLPKPTLQLSSVISKSSLPCRTGEHIVVFGTAHSGTLAIKSLLDTGCRVSAIYNGVKPFKYARDGEYDGIKQESAIIADNLPASVKLVSSSDENAVRAELIDCDWVLYACGFKPRNNIKVKINGIDTDAGLTDYDPTTGRLLGCASAFGYGIAYPNSNIVNGKTYYDVSLAAFMAHIEKNLPLIIGSLSI